LLYEKKATTLNIIVQNTVISGKMT
jgi:hypothetical protein